MWRLTFWSCSVSWTSHPIIIPWTPNRYSTCPNQLPTIILQELQHILTRKKKALIWPFQAPVPTQQIAIMYSPAFATPGNWVDFCHFAHQSYNPTFEARQSQIKEPNNFCRLIICSHSSPDRMPWFTVAVSPESNMDPESAVLWIRAFVGIQSIHFQGVHVLSIHICQSSFYYHLPRFTIPLTIILTSFWHLFASRQKKFHHLLQKPTTFFKASICLLESSPSTDALCDLLLAQLRDDAASNDDADRMAGASAWARLAALVYHYAPPRWEQNVGNI